MAQLCAKCGAQMAPGAEFCEACKAAKPANAAPLSSSDPQAGNEYAPVDIPAQAAYPAPAKSGGRVLRIVLIILAVLVGLGVIVPVAVVLIAFTLRPHAVHVADNGTEVSVGASIDAARSGEMTQVPFVGCKSDGQDGPLAFLPKSALKAVDLSSELAGHLAYYKAENGSGVLAPRGWHCLSTYGSDGNSLFVSPEPINEKQLLVSDWKGFAGPVIQVADFSGDTSGRFTVAKIIARVFPDRMKFVGNVVSEGIQPASSFPAGPYATDEVQHRGKEIVEFETPANTKGLGSQSRLAINSSPIQGVAILSGEEVPSLVQLSMRLPNSDQSLSRAIVQQLETETLNEKSGH